MRTARSRRPLLALAVPALVSLAVAVPVAAAPATTQAAPWSARLSTVDANDSNVVFAGGATTLGTGAAHAVGAGDGSRIGIQVLDRHTLATATSRVGAALAANLPHGSAADVDVRGLRPDGGWTEWAPAEHGVATLSAPSRTVQARLVLTAARGAAAPRVRALSLRAVPGAAARSGPSAQLSSRVFATREGLVGGTTANGHVIVSRDHFVALPSRRGLSANGGTEFSVQVCADNGRCEVAPVWDVGPWNTKDDYWNPSSARENWQDLAQGLPEAQAAYQQGYNGGKDGFGRTVSNPAGIDLADGTFWDGLGLTNNAFVNVNYLWTAAADRVTVHTGGGTVPMTDGPAGHRIGQVANNATVPVLQTATGPSVTGSNGTSERWYRIVGDHWIAAANTR